MGIPAGLLALIHVLACAAVAFLGWLYWALSISEGSTPGSEPIFLFLGLALFGASIVMSAALMLGRRLVGVGVVLVEVGLGMAIVLRALDESVHSDKWIWVGVLVVGSSAVGALAAAEHPDRGRAAG